MHFGLDLGVEIALRALLAPSILAARWLVPRAPLPAHEVPAMPASLARVAKVALDEIFFLTEILSATFVTMRDRTRLGTEVTAALALFEARGWLDAPVSYYVAPPPLESLQDARSVLHDRQRLPRAAAHCGFDLTAEVLPGTLDEQVRTVVVSHLEDLGTDRGARGIALTQVVAHDDSHRTLPVYHDSRRCCRTAQPADPLSAGHGRSQQAFRRRDSRPGAGGPSLGREPYRHMLDAVDEVRA